MTDVKVSIIMGVLNAEDRILESIQSIQNQTFENWEFIICDDGSKDNTYEILCELAKNDKRLKPIRNNSNLGLARTLNKCIEECNGKYIARMDDDDFSYPTRLEKQVIFLESNMDYDFVSSSIDLYDGEKITGKQIARKFFPEKKDFMWGSCFVHPATMFRAEKLKNVKGYRVSKETRRAEDYDLFMRMYAQGMRGYNFKEPLLRYYLNDEAIKKRKYRYRIDELIVRYKGFKQLGLLPKGLIYVIKPIIVGIIPQNIMIKLQKNYYR